MRGAAFECIAAEWDSRFFSDNPLADVLHHHAATRRRRMDEYFQRMVLARVANSRQGAGSAVALVAGNTSSAKEWLWSELPAYKHRVSHDMAAMHSSVTSLAYDASRMGQPLEETMLYLAQTGTTITVPHPVAPPSPK